MMRRVVGASVAALACVALLSSCSLLQGVSVGELVDSDSAQSNAEMQHIADAVNKHDAAALTNLFSVYSREATLNVSAGVKYFMSFFPSGHVTWTQVSATSDGTTASKEVFGTYDLFANGKKYELYLADKTVDQTNGPDGVGLYALGVSPFSKNPYTASGAMKSFFVWARSLGNDNGVTTGPPGIYVPQE